MQRVQRAGGCREGAESAESAEGLNEGGGGGGCGVRVGACECLCACETLCERSSGMSFICMVIGLQIRLGLRRGRGGW